MSSSKTCYQFKISLQHIDPPIWRRIQVPEDYTFWDLHVAIQDAMGWCDCHLHAFRFGRGRGERIEIGVPATGFDESSILPGWEIPIRDYCKSLDTSFSYLYDFSDGWEHTVILEDVFAQKHGTKYPVCVDGERACPPEDCGGIPGYVHLLEVLDDKSNSEYASMVDWLETHILNYFPYDAASFKHKTVRFDNPRKRYKLAFGDK